MRRLKIYISTTTLSLLDLWRIVISPFFSSVEPSKVEWHRLVRVNAEDYAV